MKFNGAQGDNIFIHRIPSAWIIQKFDLCVITENILQAWRYYSNDISARDYLRSCELNVAVFLNDFV